MLESGLLVDGLLLVANRMRRASGGHRNGNGHGCFRKERRRGLVGDWVVTLVVKKSVGQQTLSEGVRGRNFFLGGGGGQRRAGAFQLLTEPCSHLNGEP